LIENLLMHPSPDFNFRRRARAWRNNAGGDPNPISATRTCSAREYSRAHRHHLGSFEPAARIGT
jgi:hypothetical protein